MQGCDGSGAEALRLRNGVLQADVRPDLGGSLASFRLDVASASIDVLRTAPADAVHPLQMASFPLLPWCNRIAGGEFEWARRRVRLAPTYAGDPLPLHGYGWFARWSVARRTAATAELRWRHDAGEWPWSFEAVQTYALQPDGLDVRLALTNTARDTMPVGLGHHPYFPRTAATIVRAYLPVRIDTDARLVPVSRGPNPDARAFERGIRIESLRLDHGFTGWDGVARIEQPSAAAGLRLHVELHGAPGYAFHLYVPDAPYFCAEAVTNEPDAIHRPHAAAPMLALPPGATARYRMRLRVAVAADESVPDPGQTSAVPS